MFDPRGTALSKPVELNCETDRESCRNRRATNVFFSPRCFSAHWMEPPIHQPPSLDSFFIIPYPFSAFPAATQPSAPPLSASHPFSPSMSICRSHSLTHSAPCPFPLSFLVLSSHFSLIFSPPGSGQPGEFSQLAGVCLTQPSAKLTVALSRPYNG